MVVVKFPLREQAPLDSHAQSPFFNSDAANTETVKLYVACEPELPTA